MAKPLSLNNGRTWSTRTKAHAYFKEMLARYKNEERVNLADQDDLAALLAHYDTFVEPGESTKTGSGIAFFTRESNIALGWNTDGFHVLRTDNTIIDFSYVDAVYSPVTKRAEPKN